MTHVQNTMQLEILKIDAIWKPITSYWTDVIYKQPLFFFSF